VCARCVGSAKALRSEQDHEPSFWVVAPTLAKHAIVLSKATKAGRVNHEKVFRSGHYRVGNRRSGLNVGIGMALPGQ
jgi:hypothetical protein